MLNHRKIFRESPRKNTIEKNEVFFLDVLTGKDYLDLSKTWCLRIDVKLHCTKTVHLIKDNSISIFSYEMRFAFTPFIYLTNNVESL